MIIYYIYNNTLRKRIINKFDIVYVTNLMEFV